jgi:hypothetical protein
VVWVAGRVGPDLVVGFVGRSVGGAIVEVAGEEDVGEGREEGFV